MADAQGAEPQVAENLTSPHAAQLEKGFATLRFDPPLEQEFLQYYWTTHRKRIRIGLLVGIAIFLTSVVNEVKTYPHEVAWWAVVTRCGVIIPAMLLALLPTFSATRRHSFGLASWAVLTAVFAGDVVAHLASVAYGAPMPYESMMVLLAFIFFMTGLRAMQGLLSCALGISAYVVGLHWLGVDPKQVENQGFHLLFMMLIGTMGAYSRELMLRRLFLSQALATFRAEHDALTLVLNRGAAMRRLDALWRQAARESTGLAVLLIDVDHFKAYNDRYDHLEGDRCLQLVAQTTKQMLHRPMDIAARFGGEEFVGVAYGVDKDAAIGIAEKIRAAFEALRIELADGHVARVTASIGVLCVWPHADEGAPSIKHALKQADEALYSAKDGGRNRVVLRP